jgi:hypothetical protein
MHQNLAVKAFIMLNRGLLYVHLNGLGHGVQLSAYLRFSSIRSYLARGNVPRMQTSSRLNSSMPVQYVQEKMTLHKERRHKD